MTPDELVKKIQKIVTELKMAERLGWQMDDFTGEKIDDIQIVLNDYVNSWSKPSEPDPFA